MLAAELCGGAPACWNGACLSHLVGGRCQSNGRPMEGGCAPHFTRACIGPWVGIKAGASRRRSTPCCAGLIERTGPTSAGPIQDKPLMLSSIQVYPPWREMQAGSSCRPAGANIASLCNIQPAILAGAARTAERTDLFGGGCRSGVSEEDGAKVHDAQAQDDRHPDGGGAVVDLRRGGARVWAGRKLQPGREDEAHLEDDSPCAGGVLTAILKQMGKVSKQYTYLLAIALHSFICSSCRRTLHILCAFTTTTMKR